MKHSSTSFALILIASVLLLSAANAEQPNPRPTATSSTNLPQRSEGSAEQTQANSVAPAATTEALDAKPAEHKYGTADVERKDSGSKPPEDPQGLTTRDWLQIFFNFWLTVATIALAIFTWKLVGVTRDVHRATEKGTEVANENVKAARASAEAAKAQLEFTKTANEQNLNIARQSTEAAKQSAEATRQNVTIGALALKADRPYMVLEKCEIQGLPKEGPIVLENFSETKSFTLIAAIFEFKNLGKGPAIIDEVVTHLCVVAKLPEPKDFTGCQQVFINKEAVTPNDFLKTLSPFMDMFAFTKQEECDSVNNGTNLLIAYGRITYRDVFDARYETGFLFRYIPAQGERLLTNAGYVWRGPEAHNYRI
jgi:hypothetical protein